ncbi:RecF/RecN/SMC N domain protein [[Clostridium] ultunense Esp]|nr:RecF/RecN/SMC N domain protein [[Clostridium] ultunense Esp]
MLLRSVQLMVVTIGCPGFYIQLYLEEDSIVVCEGDLMYISELILENYRGFKGRKSIFFKEGTNILIGHNNSGKTSILKALELLFSDGKSKSLSIDDFNKNISIEELKESPPKIRIAAKLTESKNEEEYSDDLITVSTWLTKLDKPYEALITYEFFLPEKEEKEYKNIINNINSDDVHDYWREIEYNFIRKYIYKIYVGNPDHKNVVEPETINKFDFQFLTAIRDVERDLFTGRNSLLKEVIDFFIDYEIKTDRDMENDEKTKKIEERKKKFSEDAGKLISSLQSRMELGKKYMLKYAEETGAAFDNLKPSFEGRILDTELYSALKLIVEDETGFKLPVSQNGLGYNNLIYISLLLAKMQKDASGEYLGSNAKIFSILAIEEPEAHLHPNMQYKFLKFLKQNQENQVRQIFITSHSPNITAAASLDDLIILCKEKDEINISYPGKVFTDCKEDIISKNYVQRFLDVTKSDMFFAKNIIFVEGISEQLLIHEFAKILGYDLVDFHTSIINIGGRYFEHFLKLFDTSKSSYAINKKVACITDLDPVKKKKGDTRWKKCLPFELDSDDKYEYKDCSNDIVSEYINNPEENNIRVFSQQKGISCTFEYDIILHNPTTKELITDSVMNSEEIKDLMDAIKNKTDVSDIINIIRNGKFKDTLSIHINNGNFNNEENIVHIVAARYLMSIKKGVVAQELADVISENQINKLLDEAHFDFIVPTYISEAIEWIYKG